MASYMTPHSTAPHTPPAEHDSNSSSSTLAPQDSPASPFSASFDPNAQTPGSVASAPLYPITEGQLPRAVDAHTHAFWAHRLSASFGAIADQIAAASQALATVPASSGAPAVGGGLGAEVAALAARLETIEGAQERLGEQLQQVQGQLARLQAVGGTVRGAAAGAKQEGDVAVLEVQEEGAGEFTFKSTVEMALEELQKKVDGAVETIKLDQARLYARLHNATVTTNKMLIKAPTTANGKPPQNFPNTKGEFEHLTKERYENLLKSYNLPIKGDTNAKREALREFIGLTPAI